MIAHRLSHCQAFRVANISAAACPLFRRRHSKTGRLMSMHQRRATGSQQTWSRESSKGPSRARGRERGEEEQEVPLPVALLPVRLPPPYPQDSASLSLLRIQA